ncbi:hypothetical protein EL17_15505 [Anditalea andensis]|uniref:Uncharacterized protein n=1 Tax=Anditalea andensis TaxID=1048983 RepID=A0A074KSS5_9BACT|nr:hypothetical protein EL17_15505 [Anditalea andensis]
MLQAFSIILLLLVYLSLFFILMGMIRPVYVLWFLDRGNRLKVIYIYGVAALSFYVLYHLLSIV